MVEYGAMFLGLFLWLCHAVSRFLGNLIYSSLYQLSGWNSKAMRQIYLFVFWYVLMMAFHSKLWITRGYSRKYPIRCFEWKKISGSEQCFASCSVHETWNRLSAGAADSPKNRQSDAFSKREIESAGASNQGTRALIFPHHYWSYQYL